MQIRNHAYTKKDVTPLEDQRDLTGRIIVVEQLALKSEYRRPEYQLWRCTGGKGATSNIPGDVVHGVCLVDSDTSIWQRGAVLGVLRYELLEEAERLLGYPVDSYTYPEHQERSTITTSDKNNYEQGSVIH